MLHISNDMAETWDAPNKVCRRMQDPIQTLNPSHWETHIEGVTIIQVGDKYIIETIFKSNNHFCYDFYILLS